MVMNSQLTMKLVISILVLVSCTFADEFFSSARNFSIEFLYHTQLQSGGHIVISPLGIWSLMTVVAFGAEGNSQSQLTKALRLPSSESENPEYFELGIVSGYQSVMSTVLDTADGSVDLVSYNFMFLAEAFDVNPSYKRKLRNFLKSDIWNLNVGQANEVAKSANELIKASGAVTSDLFDPEDFSTSRFIVINVVKFKGRWKIPFDESATKVEPFYDENKNKIGEANMMFKEDVVRVSEEQTLQSSVLELPYGNDNKFCMLLILPNEKIKVTEPFQNLQKVSIQKILNKLEQGASKTVKIKLPRFKISSKLVLNKPLMDMGVNDIFVQGSASFTPIVTENNVFISTAVHNANIEVTEIGMPGPAVSTAGFQDGVSSSFEANRPFIYFIMEKLSATIIFGGIYSEPSVV